MLCIKKTAVEIEVSTGKLSAAASRPRIADINVISPQLQYLLGSHSIRRLQTMEQLHNQSAKGKKN
jgi:hypothetical protein